MTVIGKYIQNNVTNALKEIEYIVLPQYQLKQGDSHLKVKLTACLLK